jgi:hypothetical protein
VNVPCFDPNAQIGCSEALCNGKDGVCKHPYFANCACHDTPCPDYDQGTLICNVDCGGKGANGKCKGVGVS